MRLRPRDYFAAPHTGRTRALLSSDLLLLPPENTNSFEPDLSEPPSLQRRLSRRGRSDRVEALADCRDAIWEFLPVLSAVPRPGKKFAGSRLRNRSWLGLGERAWLGRSRFGAQRRCCGDREEAWPRRATIDV